MQKEDAENWNGNTIIIELEEAYNHYKDDPEFNQNLQSF